MPSRLPAHLETRAQPRRAVLATITATALAASGVHGFAIPSAAQLRWQGYEVGAMVTFGMQTMMSPAQRHCGAPLPSADKFNPTALDTDQWVASAVAFGAQYAVLVADHFSGFSLWPTTVDGYNYSVAASPWGAGGRDVVAEFMASCDKAGIAGGVFYSVHENWYRNVCDFTVRNGTPSEQQKYNEDSAAQVQELLTRYKPQELWFDAGYQPSINPDVARVVRQSAQGIPCHSCHVNDTDSGIRWMGNEDAQQPLPNWGATDDCEITGAAGAPHFCPTSCDTVLRQHYWFWHNGTENTIKPTKELVTEYLTSVGRGCNLILNIGPDPTGAVPSADVPAYAAFGAAWQELFNASRRLSTAPAPLHAAPHATSVEWSAADQAVSLTQGAIVLQEDLSAGQHIASFNVSAVSATGAAQALGSPRSTLGHKAIVPFNLSSAFDATRFVVDLAMAPGTSTTVTISRAEVYDWRDARFVDWDAVLSD